jgi:hypothetical protein
MVSMAHRTKKLPVEYVGQVWLKGSKTGAFGLSHCLYVPGLSHKLIAGGVLPQKGMTT